MNKQTIDTIIAIIVVVVVCVILNGAIIWRIKAETNKEMLKSELELRECQRNLYAISNNSDSASIQPVIQQ